jgi:transcriptional regulator with XRE-family HTH domain
MSKNSIGVKDFPEVVQDLEFLGEYIRIARKRRKQTMKEVAERTRLGYQTIVRIEQGDPGVSISAYLGVLWLFGLDKEFVNSLHPERDKSGLALEIMGLPKRVAKAKKEDDYDF